MPICINLKEVAQPLYDSPAIGHNQNCHSSNRSLRWQRDSFGLLMDLFLDCNDIRGNLIHDNWDCDRLLGQISDPFSTPGDSNFDLSGSCLKAQSS